MENKLRALFDYQRFQRNEQLAKIIEETEERYRHKLSDNEVSLDELEHVNAAGDVNAHSQKPFNKEGFDK